MCSTLARDSAVFRIRSALDLHMAVVDVTHMPALAQFSVVDVSLLATVVAELGSNILKYAGKGQIRLRVLQEDQRHGVEILAEDAGPGIADTALALQEHYSSSGSLGLGLSGVRRMVSEFQLSSAPGQGCRVHARKWMLPERGSSGLQTLPPPAAAPSPPAADSGKGLRLDIAELNRPCYPEYVSGDCTVVQPLRDGLLLACIDASGHGKRAHAVAQPLAKLLRHSASDNLAQLLQLLHQRCMGTLGAAVGLVFVYPARAELVFAGIGNVRVRCVGRTPWTGISRDGVLGERFPTPDVQRFPLHADDVVLLYSDGIRETLSAPVLARARLCTAQQTADSLLREGGKTTDDASCIVLKCKR